MTEPTATLTIRLPRGEYDRLQRLAERLERSKNYLANTAISRYLAAVAEEEKEPHA